MNGGGFFTEPFGFFSVVARQTRTRPFFLLKRRDHFIKNLFKPLARVRIGVKLCSCLLIKLVELDEEFFFVEESFQLLLASEST